MNSRPTRVPEACATDPHLHPHQWQLLPCSTNWSRYPASSIQHWGPHPLPDSSWQHWVAFVHRTFFSGLWTFGPSTGKPPLNLFALMLTWSVGNMAASSEGEVTAEVQAYLEKHKISSLMKVREDEVGKQTVHASWVRDRWFLLTGLDVKDCQGASRWPSGVPDFKTANFAQAEEEGTCSNNVTLGADFHSHRWVVFGQ